MVKNQTILITGGTGSFGKKFMEVICKFHKPKKVIIYSRDELKQHEMEEEFSTNKNINTRYFIGDVRDLSRLKLAMVDVDVVIHAAALKHVPISEYNPFETVKTNIIGGQNVIDASLSCGVQKVIALSTDKAVAPINLYGATKLTSDKLFIAANNYKGKKDIKFSVVRYGNVMGSRGSVIPYFLTTKKQGYINITDTKMTRFNITLNQGVDFVIKCLNRMWGGEILIPKIPSYRITDLAKTIAPNIKPNIIGIRPGEKIHEEMITSTDSLNTVEFKDYYVILPNSKYIVWDTKKFLESNNSSSGKFCESGFSYNSLTNKKFLTTKELLDLIIKNVPDSKSLA